MLEALITWIAILGIIYGIRIWYKKKKILKSVRIEKLNPFEKRYEKDTDTVWFEGHNIEQCIKAVKRLKIKHIHFQTHTLDFLNDKRLNDVQGDIYSV